MESHKLNGIVYSEIRVGIIVSQFNETITSRLLSGAQEALMKVGVPNENVDIKWVPGAFEIPQIALRMAETGQWDALVTLGCVIRGETSHYDVVVNESCRGITEAAMLTGIPITLGILTTENSEQAFERSGGSIGNKGAEDSLAAIEMAVLYRAIDTE